MALDATHYRILQDTMSGFDGIALTHVTCDMARGMRPALTAKLSEAVMGDCGAVTQVGSTSMDTPGYLKALQELIGWTYDICKQAAEEEGPYLATVYPDLPWRPDPCHTDRCNGWRMCGCRPPRELANGCCGNCGGIA